MVLIIVIENSNIIYNKYNFKKKIIEIVNDVSTPLRIFFENNDWALHLNLTHPLQLVKLEYFFYSQKKKQSTSTLIQF